MAVKLRMKRMGRRHRSFFRVGAVDSRNQRDGKVIEELGWYDPNAKDADKQLSLNDERIKHWLSVGAQPSDTVADLLKRAGIIEGETPNERRAKVLAAKAAKARVEAEAKAAAEAEAAAKAEAEAAAKAAAEAAAAPEGEAAPEAETPEGQAE